MLMLKRIFAGIFMMAALLACNNHNNTSTSPVADTAKTDGHPAWIMQGNIYEVNVRQYTKEGTFNAFSKHLDRLKEMGVQTLWFMPINPISKTDRKGALGSYYAVANYTAINPEYGNLSDWNTLVKTAHEKGFKVIIDWVPNHTGADHPWLQQHPDFYVHDSTGKIVSPFDWTDVRKLNYQNPALCDSMINSMKFWIKESDIDGFRCDVAGDVPDSFWKKAITILKKEKNIFMLAEGNKGNLQADGFDATYPWDEFAMMKKIAKGERPAFGLDSVIHKVDSTFPKNSLLMYFTSNHDENSWNKADYATMPGEVHAPFAVLTQTIGRSVPLIYGGQEEPVSDSISFFYKDSIKFKNFKRAPFYKTLLNVHSGNPALAANASFKKLVSSNDAAIYAYVRENQGHRILVILNLSATEQHFTLNYDKIEGNPVNIFTGQKEPLKSGTNFDLSAWGYKVFEY